MVENLDDRLGIFGARFPYFERRFQFRIQFHKRTPGSSPFLGSSNPYWTFWAHIGRILDARPDAEMQNKKPPIWRSGTRPGAGRVFGEIHVRINKQHSSQPWRLAAAGVTTGGAAVQPARGRAAAAAHAAALDRLDWQLARLRRELKRLRGGRTKGRRSSPSWPRWQAAQVAGKLAIPFTRFKVPAIFIWSFGWLPQMAEGRRAFHPFQGASERGWEISSHLICLSLKKYLSGTGSVSMRGSFDARV